MKEAYTALQKQFGDRIKRDVPLAPFTTYKIGGLADVVFEARTKEELVAIITSARRQNIPCFILGGGTNILVRDQGIRGLVVRNLTSSITMKGVKGQVKGNKKIEIVYLEVDSGVPFNRLVRFSLDEGLQGLEMHLGLPGSVGGAVAMNSKWMRPPGFVGDCVYQADILTLKNEIQTVKPEYFHFSYGKSSIPKHGDILLSVIFGLTRSTKEAVWAIANESISYRRQTQPQGVATAGCVFKNVSKAEAMVGSLPDGVTSAGYLLDKSGCKTLRVGDAAVSPVHANFIVNTGHATASDVIQLIDHMKKRVENTFGIVLKEEIQIVGV